MISADELRKQENLKEGVEGIFQEIEKLVKEGALCGNRRVFINWLPENSFYVVAQTLQDLGYDLEILRGGTFGTIACPSCLSSDILIIRW
jgi:hypothetical protein